MTSGGLTATDLGRKESIGGLALEFYNRIGRKSGFRPSEAESLYLQMLNEEGVGVLLGRALKSVEMNGNRLLSICMESGETIRAAMFVDAPMKETCSRRRMSPIALDASRPVLMGNRWPGNSRTFRGATSTSSADYR